MSRRVSPPEHGIGNLSEYRASPFLHASSRKKKKEGEKEGREKPRVFPLLAKNAASPLESGLASSKIMLEEGIYQESAADFHRSGVISGIKRDR